MQDAAGKLAWSYDVMGRVVTDKRKTSNKTKVFDYAYNLDGSIQSITYPSGQRVDYSYNAAGRAVSATDVGSGTQLATQALYAPHGAPVSLQTGVGGGFAGYSRTWSYNERLQPVTIVAASPTQTVFDLTYDFGLGVANNGNVKLIFNNLNGERTQSFSYDGLNRIETASVPTDWGLSYAYDRYGNLLDKSVTQGGGPTALHVTVNTKNRINSGGFSYDVAGNLTNYSGQAYAYDAENRMTSAAGVGYTYDGDGRRVKKSNGKLYWYSVSGEVLQETNLSGNLLDEYIFFNGQRIARRKASGEVNYYFSDHLGSSRVVTNDAGQILDDADFYPFGGKRPVTSSSGNNYKFTGQERDAESGLDHFWFRKYSSSLGRWLSPDLVAIPANPQTLNKYSYVANNPLQYIDPLGLLPVTITSGDKTFVVDSEDLRQAGFTIRTDGNGNIIGIVAPKSGANFVNSEGENITTVEGGASLDFSVVQMSQSITVTAPEPSGFWGALSGSIFGGGGRLAPSQRFNEAQRVRRLSPRQVPRLVPGPPNQQTTTQILKNSFGKSRVARILKAIGDLLGQYFPSPAPPTIPLPILIDPQITNPGLMHQIQNPRKTT